MRQTQDDDILRDGQTFRVPMTAMDAANQRALADRFRADGSSEPSALLRFADGGSAVPIGSRPGYITSDALETVRRDAYEASKREMCDAWRTPPPADKPGGAAATPPRAPVSMADSWRIRSAAYEESVQALCDAWKGGKP
jgi:hypothetical protein